MLKKMFAELQLCCSAAFSLCLMVYFISRLQRINTELKPDQVMLNLQQFPRILLYLTATGLMMRSLIKEVLLIVKNLKERG